MTPVQLPSAGDSFLGRWRIVEEVGKGGFSIVYRAIDDTGRVAAIKILLPEVDDSSGVMSYDGELADRFLREARVLEQLDSPYTIRMWEFGQSPEGLYFMTFEFIEGRNLFDEIRDHGALAPDRVIHILRQLLIGLRSAHELGILHRDIKPNNVMLFERDGDPDRVKLVDFGIAKLFGEGRQAPGMDLTAAGLLVGTPRYMSPEQLRNRPLGPPSDLYSLGLCAIEMLTGRKCIPGRDRIKIVEVQLRPESCELPADVDCAPGLRSIVHKLAQKDPMHRYQDAAEAIRNLEALAGDPGATGDTVFQVIPSTVDALLTQESTPDEDTVVHRVNSNELDRLIADSQSIRVRSDSLGPPAASAAQDDATIADSTGSGRFQQPPVLQQPVAPQNVPFPSYPGGNPPADVSSSASPQASGILETNEKIALAASFVVPGAGHLVLGQLKKGGLFVAALVLTVGFGWLLLAPAALLDAFLIIRTRKRRSVGELEFFPDFQDLL